MRTKPNQRKEEVNRQKIGLQTSFGVHNEEEDLSSSYEFIDKGAFLLFNAYSCFFFIQRTYNSL